VSWQVVDERLERDDDGSYLQLVAERDFGEAEDLPNHELEHVEARREEFPEAAQATFARADDAGLEVELVALEPGEAPDWAEAEAYIDALILEEIEDDLLEQCGVDPNNDPRESWLDTVKNRLRSGSTSRARTTRSRSGSSATGASSRRSAATRTRATPTAATAGFAGSPT
jgi:hypothetical protein